ncbi:MAG: LacI family DNA-binding transcriptional regulator [Chloroflexi bacterium]|nr:LacI family DNA-binding transcriptional regulator [Chloroflexota bacterium]
MSVDERRGRPTIRDVARHAGVSITTASRVVNGKPYVQRELVDRVRAAITELGYRRNDLARGLKVRRSRSIALVIADLSNPFYGACAAAIEETCRSRGYSLLLCSSDEKPDIEQAYLQLLLQRQAEGILLIPTDRDHSDLVDEQTAGIEIVAIDRPIQGLATDCVVVDNDVAAKAATQHLLDHGHSRIAYIGAAPTLYTNVERLRGYESALAGAGRAPIVRMGAASVGSARRAAQSVLQMKDPPTAIFTMNNLVTVGVLQAAHEAGLEVPRDLAIVAFDDVVLADVLRPRLTVIRQPARELGEAAARMLIERLEGAYSGVPRIVRLPTTFVVRESCGCHAETQLEGPRGGSLQAARS